MYSCFVFFNSASTTFTPTTSPNPPPPPPPPPSNALAIIGGAAGASIALIVAIVVVLVVVIICCCCVHSNADPEAKRTRRFNWRLSHRDAENGNVPMIQLPPSSGHVSPSKRFHSKNTPEYLRQNAIQYGARKNSLDPPEEHFYNGGSIISATSGVSALTDEDEAMSCPPSPVVSDYEEGEERDKFQHGPSVSAGDEVPNYELPPPTQTQSFEQKGYPTGHQKHLRLMPVDQPKHLAHSHCHVRERSESPDQTKHQTAVSGSLVEEEGNSSSYKSSIYPKLLQYAASDSGYTGSGRPTSQTVTLSITRPRDLQTVSRGSRQRAWSPTSCLSDFTNYEIFREMFRSKITPECVRPTATLSKCTNTGVKYFDKSNDFHLDIPEGAIPEGESITIDIGVALYGPFQYPEGLRPVSPVFWLCVRDKKLSQFLKPVTVTIPHFLHLENGNDIESLELSFLKGDHVMNSQQMYQFQKLEGSVNMLFKPLKKYGVLQTTHFCYLCISSKISLKLIRKAMFCVYAAIPRVMSPREPAYVYFFVTFLLSTCLNTLKNQLSKIPELHDHIKKTHDFKFSKHSRDPALGIILSPSIPPDWTVGLQFNKEVCVATIVTCINFVGLMLDILHKSTA